jgi:protein-disulfide isomerase
MKKQFGWFTILVVMALLVVACGPQMATPTPRSAVPAATEEPAPGGDTEAEAEAPAELPTAEPATEPLDVADLPVDSGDFHILGSPEAPVTIVEYSDFQ